MVYPIVAYGANILRQVAEPIGADYPDLEKLIADMWDTMYASSGVGLAAPQINKPVRLFVVDSAQIIEGMEPEERAEHPGDEGIKEVFINAEVIGFDGEPWFYNEGCLSIPKIREDVKRPETVTIRYLDAALQPQEKTFSGITARVIQHEYDHIEGKLFIDYLSPLKRKLLRGKLNDITKGKVRMDYRLIMPA